MKGRVISFFEIEERVRELAVELESNPLDVDSILEKGKVLPFLIHLCISQMQAVNSNNYPDKNKHYEILQKASQSITYKMNNCTFSEIQSQVNDASKAFGVQ
jgi:hypothetical protein